MTQKRRFAFSTIAVLALALLATGGFLREYLRSIDTRREIAQLEEENTRLEKDRDGAKALIDQLSSEYYLETQARKQGFAKPGETMVVVADDASAAESSVADSGDGLNNPARWFMYLFDPARFSDLNKL